MHVYDWFYSILSYFYRFLNLMKPKFPSLLLQLLFCIVSFCTYGSPTIHQSPQPSWVTHLQPSGKAPNARDITNGYYLALVEEQIHVEQKASFNHIIREIVSDAGIQNASQISVVFDPAFEQVNFHTVTVWRNGQPQNRLSIPAFKILANETDLSMFLYHGSYNAYLILDDIRKGDRIEFSYTITGANPIFGDKCSRFVYLQSDQWIAHIYTSVLAAPNRKIRIKAFNNAPLPRQSVSNGLTHYEWEEKDVKPVIYVGYEPSWLNLYKHLQLSDYADWGEVVNWCDKINPPSASLKGPLAERVSQLKASSGADEASYFREAVKIVQDEVRYMGIEMGEYSHRANVPEKVYEQRYGDCKDKSLLLVSMLRANGIEAYMALVNTNMRSHTDDLLPAANMFNHAVAMAVIDGKEVWVDPTVSYQGGEKTNIYFPYYERALIVKPGNSRLSHIPKSPSGKVSSIERFEVVSDTLPVNLFVTTNYTLDRADQVRQIIANQSIIDIEKSYLDYYAKIFAGVERIDTISIQDNRNANTITVTERYIIKNFFTKNPKTRRLDASFYAEYIKSQLPTIAENRQTPVDLSFPNDIDYTIEVTLPSAWSVPAERKEIDRDEYRFIYNYSADGNTLTLHYELSSKKDYVSADKVQQFATDINEIRDQHLGYSFSYNPGISGDSGSVNIWMILWILLVAGVCIYLCIRIYKRRTAHLHRRLDTPWQIGGWLYLVFIGLLFTPVKIIYLLFTSHFFSSFMWAARDGMSHEVLFKVLVAYEATGNAFLFCWSVFCFVLMVRRRDILPKCITILYGFNALFVTVDIIASNFLQEGDSSDWAELVRVILFAGIWITYFKRSERVRQTFVVPYPDTYEIAPAVHDIHENTPQELAMSDLPATNNEEQYGQKKNGETMS